jgi:hypothetical protein
MLVVLSPCVWLYFLLGRDLVFPIKSPWIFMLPLRTIDSRVREKPKMIDSATMDAGQLFSLDGRVAMIVRQRHHIGSNKG